MTPMETKWEHNYKDYILSLSKRMMAYARSNGSIEKTWVDKRMQEVMAKIY